MNQNSSVSDFYHSLSRLNISDKKKQFLTRKEKLVQLDTWLSIGTIICLGASSLFGIFCLLNLMMPSILTRSSTAHLDFMGLLFSSALTCAGFFGVRKITSYMRVLDREQIDFLFTEFSDFKTLTTLFKHMDSFSSLRSAYDLRGSFKELYVLSKSGDKETFFTKIQHAISIFCQAYEEQQHDNDFEEKMKREGFSFTDEKKALETTGLPDPVENLVETIEPVPLIVAPTRPELTLTEELIEFERTMVSHTPVALRQLSAAR